MNPNPDQAYAQLDAFVVVQAVCARSVYAWRLTP